MSKINILDESVFNKIAAGEVVEKPASVIKELLDNAIDAGASKITICITNGGIDNITITDDGSGIEPDDFSRVFVPHATSKIKTSEDLEKIGTLGFRGEALASIASVSKVELTSKIASETFGRKCEVVGGKQSEEIVVGSDDGTTISVSNLFFNVPARAKFLRKPKTEMADITNLVERYVLCNPTISFLYVADGKTILQSTGTNLMDAIYVVYGKQATDGIIMVNSYSKNSGIKVSGYIGLPTFTKPNRTYQTLSVNGRYVNSPLISTSVGNAYDHFLMKGQFPFYVLNLDIPLQKLDVNVHPNKMEVRFGNSNEIFGNVYNAISTALYNCEKITSVTEPIGTYKSAQSGISFSETESENKDVKTVDIFAGGTKPNINDFDITSKTKNEQISFSDYSQNSKSELDKNLQNLAVDENSQITKFADNLPSDDIDYSNQKANGNLETQSNGQNLENQTSTMQKASFLNSILESHSGSTLHESKSPIFSKMVLDNLKNSSQQSQSEFLTSTETQNGIEPSKTDEFFETSDVKFVGEIFATYLIIEKQQKVYIIDEHAGHERLLFDRLVKEVDSHNVSKQSLLVSYHLDVNRQEFEFLEENLDKLKAIGFEIEQFGELSFVVTAIPSILSNINLNEFFGNVLSDLTVMKNYKQSDLIINRLMQHSCKCAVRAGKILSAGEVNSLISQMKEEKMQLQCPHGRPVVVELSKTDIEKWFKRIV